MSTCANIFVQVPQKYKYIRRFGHAKHRCNTLNTKHIRHNFAYVKQPIAVATYRGKTNFKSKIMSLNEIIQSGTNVSITIGANDLLQFANHLIRTTKEELENTILAKKKETYITPDEASKQLHVDRSTLWRWSKTGYLTPVEVGGKRLYKQSDIDIILSK